MADVKYRPDEWEKAQKALEELLDSGWFTSGIEDYIKDIHENMEEAGDDIRKLDSDGVISFSYEDTTGKFRKLLQDFGVLKDFTDKVGDTVDRVIDQPFYKEMDAFATAMRNLSIENYTTKNTIGATEVKVTYTGGYGPDAYKTTEFKKDKINMMDILNGNNFFAEKMKVDYERFKQENPDEDFSFKDYQHAALNTRAFQYESIEDKQQKKEFWRDIIIGAAIIVTGIICPPAGLALGVAYGALELGSAASGKDWMTGRELGTGERWFRGAFSLLDIVPGVKGLHAFGKAAQTPEVILKAAQLGTSTNLKTAVKQGRPSIQAMLNTAAGKATQRVRQVQASARDAARTALENAKPGIIQAAKKTDELLTSVKNMKLPGRELVPAEGVVTGAKNSHSVENMVQKIINKAEDNLNPPPRSGGGGGIPKNDPLSNPKIAKEIEANPDAVYGYSPKKGSPLDKFGVDWTDPKQVASARSKRMEYLQNMEQKKIKLEKEVAQLRSEGMSIEEIAKMKVEQRNRDRMQSYIDSNNYEGLAAMKERNIQQYGRAEGPTPEQLFEKYGSWEELIYSSVRTSPAMDVLTGLYKP